MLDLLRRALHPASDHLTRPRPPLASGQGDLAPVERENADLLAEYGKLSKSLGLANPHIDADLRIERFKAFLRAKDWAVFALPTVIAYMDAKAKEEATAQSGWHWRPLRAKDHIPNVLFGNAARAFQQHHLAASDHYFGEHEDRSGGSQMQYFDGNGHIKNGSQTVPPSGHVYDKLVPIHALRKVAAIEAEFREPVAFFVCDYAPAPHIEHPDPFLMVVINNERLSKGAGRFVIDFWDEPGFGIEEQTA